MTYSNVIFDKKKSKIHLFEYEDGEKKHRIHDAPLYFYVNDTDGEFTAVDGTKVKKIVCEVYGAYYECIESYRKMGFTTYESDIAIETKFINEYYTGKELVVPKFDIHFLDIEVHSDKGFPRPEEANFPITVITTWSTKRQKFFVFAEKDFDVPLEASESMEKFIYKDEVVLLRQYAKWLSSEFPDILTGWNSAGFDLPYIINRMKNIMGEDSIKKLSPLGRIFEVPEKVGTGDTARTVMRYSIAGINCMDLLDAYKKFTPGEKESYKLDFIAQLELGKSKVKYEGTLIDLYKDWNKYILYNIQDVRLLRELEDKRGYLQLSVSFCYGCRVPFNQISKVTKLIDGAILAELSKEGIVLPDVNRDAPNVQYPGGYVKDPEPGLYEWVMSFDATSLYPSIMMGWNISPDTKIAVINKPFIDNTIACLSDKQYKDLKFMKDGEATSIREICDNIRFQGIKTINENGGIHGLYSKKAIDEITAGLSGREFKDLPVFLNYEKTTVGAVVKLIQEKDYIFSMNGVLYTKAKKGIIPRFVEDWFNKRKHYKKLMLEAKKNHDTVKEKYYDNLQFNYKILINSAYGYAGTPYSRFYDFDNAAAVCICGQYITRSVGEGLDKFFATEWASHKVGSKLKCENFTNISVYNDTDSCYLSVGKLLNSIKLLDVNKKYSNDQIKNLITFGKPLKDVEVYNITENEGETVYNIKDEFKKVEYENPDTIQNIIVSIINKETSYLTLKLCNCAENKIDFKREAIIRRGIFLKRKRYVSWVLNNEGINCDKLKCVGVEIVRNQTPLIIQDILENLVFDMLKYNDKAAIDKAVVDFREVFMKTDPAKIASPVSVRTLEKYEEKLAKGEKVSTPMNVRATRIYNAILESHPEFQTHYPKIYDHTKIKTIYMKEDANYRHNIFGFVDTWPTLFDLEKNIDYEFQFEKTFLGILKKFYALMNWEFPNFNIENVDNLFGWET